MNTEYRNRNRNRIQGRVIIWWFEEKQIITLTVYFFLHLKGHGYPLKFRNSRYEDYLYDINIAWDVGSSMHIVSTEIIITQLQIKVMCK